ncbi:MAG: alpha/beta hydrolase [Jiangellaceae bacterium]
MIQTGVSAGPVVDARGVAFTVSDPGRSLLRVRLVQEIGLSARSVEFERADGRWRLRIGRGPADRLEYMLEIHRADGSVEVGPDPDNPRRVGGVFGEKSVVEFPGYVPPAWLSASAPPGRIAPFSVASRHLDASVTGSVWTAPGLHSGDPAPLLVVHDGPEYDRLAELTRFLAVCVSGGAVPPLRALLLQAGERNVWYAAEPAYARALVDEVLPSVPASRRIGMGTSLGALAMLHAYRHDPDGFAGLFLQSGSFFTEELDPQERRFPRFAEITRFVAQVHEAGVAARPAPVGMTCGSAEENLACNQLMAGRLAAQGHEVAFHVVRDAHNYTSWRDGFHPHLPALLRASSS